MSNRFLISFMALLLMITSVVAYIIYDTNQNNQLRDPEFNNQLLEQIDSKVDFEEMATLGFVGDLMFDRHIRAKQHDTAYLNSISPELIDFLNSSDGIVGNLEGSITNFEPVSDYDQNNPNHYRFTFDPLIIPLLKKANFVAVSLGNNHSINFGTDGLTQTIKYLTGADISSFGNPNDSEHTLVFSIRDIKFGLVAYNYADSIPIEKILENIDRLKDTTDHVIVVPHWGTEYETNANISQQNLARKFVDAGADLIIGSHPHVIQNSESIDDAIVYYSLGNFVFDQYFQPEVRCGLVLNIQFTKHNFKVVDYKYSYLEPAGITRLAKDSECINFDQQTPSN